MHVAFAAMGPDTNVLNQEFVAVRGTFRTKSWFEKDTSK